jgi:hypothetical protein
MTRTLSTLVAVLSLAAAAPAVATESTCATDEFPPAAASPVGSWIITETLCVEVPNLCAMISPGCVGATQDISTEFSGTISFEPGLPSGSAPAYTRAVVQTTAGEIRMPLTCLATAELTCEGEGPMGPATVDGDNCVITMNQVREITEAGVWEINDDQTVTAEPRTRDGQPATGEDAEPRRLGIYAEPDSTTTMLLEVHGRGGARIVMSVERAVE